MPDPGRPPDPARPYSFFDPDGPVTEQLKKEGYGSRPHPPEKVPFEPQPPVQVWRVHDIDPSTKARNEEFQRLLGDTVWRNYRLVGTQWATQKDPRNEDDYTPFPEQLANVTMETYLQSRGTCIDCHAYADESRFVAFLQRRAVPGAPGERTRGLRRWNQIMQKRDKGGQ